MKKDEICCPEMNSTETNTPKERGTKYYQKNIIWTIGLFAEDPDHSNSNNTENIEHLDILF